MFLQDLLLTFLFVLPLLAAVSHYSFPNARHNRMRLVLLDSILLAIIAVFWFWLFNNNYELNLHYVVFPVLSLTLDIKITIISLMLLTIFEIGNIIFSIGSEIAYYPRSRLVSSAIFRTGLIGTLLLSNVLFFLLSLETMLLSLHFAIYGLKKEDVRKSTAYMLFTQTAFVILLSFYLIVVVRNPAAVLLTLDSLLEAITNNVIAFSTPFLLFGLFGWLLIIPVFPFFAWIKDTMLVSKCPISYIALGGMTTSLIYSFYRWYFALFYSIFSKTFQVLMLSIFIVSAIITSLLIYKCIALKSKFIYIFITELHVILIGYATLAQQASIVALLYLLFIPLSTALSMLLILAIRKVFGTDSVVQLEGLLQKEPNWRFHILLILLIVSTIPFVPFLANILILIFIFKLKLVYWFAYVVVWTLVSIAIGNLGATIYSYSILYSKNLTQIVLEQPSKLDNKHRKLLTLLFVIYFVFNILVLLFTSLLQINGGTIL